MIQIDMPMPKVCDDCPFMDEDHGDYPYCIALGQNRGYTFRIREKRFPNCPLKSVEEQKEDTETDKLKNMCRVFSTDAVLQVRLMGKCAFFVE